LGKMTRCGLVIFTLRMNLIYRYKKGYRLLFGIWSVTLLWLVRKWKSQGQRWHSKCRSHGARTEVWTLCTHAWGRKETITRERILKQIFYSEIGGHVLIPFFDTCLANARVKEVADGSWRMLKQSWPTGRYDIAANGAELALIVYVNKLSRGVWVVY
jgi:hypothetical protein